MINDRTAARAEGGNDLVGLRLVIIRQSEKP
jgi:hypothetical protein